MKKPDEAILHVKVTETLMRAAAAKEELQGDWASFTVLYALSRRLEADMQSHGPAAQIAAVRRTIGKTKRMRERADTHAEKKLAAYLKLFGEMLEKDIA
jgi:hypothetical protein